jgi:ribosome-associated protein
MTPDEELLKQCRIETFRSKGPGGQHANVTNSAVRLTHLATGLSVSCQNERSQFQNKMICLERLKQKLERFYAKKTPRIATKVPKSEKKLRLKEKKKSSAVKKLRQKPSSLED